MAPGGCLYALRPGRRGDAPGGLGPHAGVQSSVKEGEVPQVTGPGPRGVAIPPSALVIKAL